jgi:amphi-Trp domain-containing protein
MPETVLFGSERQSTRADVASYLRTVADRLETGETVTLEAGSESVTMDPPGTHTGYSSPHNRGYCGVVGRVETERKAERAEGPRERLPP